jgi:hypothetical protein
MVPAVISTAGTLEKSSMTVLILRRGAIDHIHDLPADMLRTEVEPCACAAHDKCTKKSGERRVGERLRDDKCGQRDARDEVEANRLAVYVGIQRNAATQPTVDPRNPL